MKESKTAEDFYHVFLKLLDLKGYEKITILDLCNESGYSRSEFYSLFLNMEDLLNKVIDDKLFELSILLNDSDSSDYYYTSSYEKTIHQLTEINKFIQHNGAFLKTVLREDRITNFRLKMMDVFWKTFKNSKYEKWTIYKDDRDKYDFSIIYFVSGITGVLYSWIQDDFKHSAEYIANQICIIKHLHPHDFLIGKIKLNYGKENSTNDLDVRISRTKDAFKQAFLNLLTEKDYSTITISDVAKRAEYNRSTFYRHYKDIDDLYKTVLSDFTNNLLKEFFAGDTVNTPIHRVFEYIYSEDTLVSIMYSQRGVPGFFDAIYQELRKVLEQTIKSEITIDINIYCHYSISSIMSFIILWVSRKRIYSPRYIASLYIEFLKNDRLTPISTP